MDISTVGILYFEVKNENKNYKIKYLENAGLGAK